MRAMDSSREEKAGQSGLAQMRGVEVTGTKTSWKMEGLW